MRLHEVFDGVATVFEAVGVLAIVVGFLVSFYLWLSRLVRGEAGALQVLRTAVGSSILLGLEILVAADLIRTITSEPSLENVGVLAIIVLLRTVLSWSIQIEIEGTLPWKRALTESGGAILARTVAAERGRHEALDDRGA
ncbi:hypothetical protein GOARA_064_01830 [Gordonia araii NBRC 100433]|uniref:DUF1622 domain-containing protein n=1 Tax=Gordonia araii NBRC 100433 TaxID=1073574 RepID=G7H5Q6_9ACTN|nr:DUF1622 domain-containing protein [Gordonia araii]NNG95893.1 DUF1622 domain-containing protein [Gordonia araii NBRC 100433]GAB11181.1 hypothetical protein GOARA_064_01830 [Gordonia araii NBRC 100433]